MKHPVIGLLTVMILLFRLLGSTTAFADSSVSDENIHAEGRWYVGPRVGPSQFTGIIGLEIQKDHFGLTVGPRCQDSCRLNR